jgi:hypothetical protein
MNGSGFRWWAVAMAAVVATVALGVVPAQADAGDAARLLALTNQVRASQGLPALTTDPQLTAVAQAWATELAGRGVISHNPSVRAQVRGWEVLGENVGVGGNVDAIHAGFVASPTHYANLVDSAYTKVGFGIVRPDARIFVVEVFMLPASAAPVTPAPARAQTPARAPAPAAPVTTVTTVKPSATPVAVPPPPPPAAAAELSPWMVHSIDLLRSMEPATAG